MRYDWYLEDTINRFINEYKMKNNPNLLATEKKKTLESLKKFTQLEIDRSRDDKWQQGFYEGWNEAIDKLRNLQ